MQEIPLHVSMESDFASDTMPELIVSTDFRLYPFDESRFNEGALTILRAQTATNIKESLQDFSRLGPDERMSRSKSVLSEYTWVILSDLNMTDISKSPQLIPTEAYTKAFSAAYDKALHPKECNLSEILDRFEDHPALRLIDTVQSISPKTPVFQTEIVQLRRSLLVILDEYGT